MYRSGYDYTFANLIWNSIFEVLNEGKIPQEVVPILKKAELYLEAEDYDKAIDLAIEAHTSSDVEYTKDFLAYTYAIRANSFFTKKEYDNALKDFNSALKISPTQYVCNAMGWFFATCPDPEYRNGNKAIEYAEKSISYGRALGNVHTLAAAHAEVGNFEKAAQLEFEAMSLCPEEKRGDLQRILVGYQSHKTYVQIVGE